MHTYRARSSGPKPNEFSFREETRLCSIQTGACVGDKAGAGRRASIKRVVSGGVGPSRVPPDKASSSPRPGAQTSHAHRASHTGPRATAPSGPSVRPSEPSSQSDVGRGGVCGDESDVSAPSRPRTSVLYQDDPSSLACNTSLVCRPRLPGIPPLPPPHLPTPPP